MKSQPTSHMLSRIQRRAQSGQAIVLIALMMVGLLGMAGLALDGGSLLLLQRQAQKVADLAAMSAAIARCEGANDDTVRLRAFETAEANEVDRANVQVSFPSSTDTEVIVRLPKDPYFIQLVYDGPMTAQGRSVTRCGRQRSVYDGYVLFATSTVCGDQTLHVTGSSEYFEGSFFSNTDVQINTGDMEITGSVEFVGRDLPYNDQGGWPHTRVGGNGPRFVDPNAGDAVIKHASPREAPLLFDIADYRPGGAKALEAGADYHVLKPSGSYYYTGPGIPSGSHWYNWDTASWNTNQVPRSGLIYVPGDLGMSGPGVFRADETKGLTIVTEGKMNINGPGIEIPKPFMDGLALYSAERPNRSVPVTETSTHTGGSCYDQYIMTPSDHTYFNGLIYSPFGRVLVPTSNVAASHGAIIAYTIGIYVSGADIRYRGDHLPAGDPNLYYVE